MSRLKDSLDDAAQLAAPDMNRESYDASRSRGMPTDAPSTGGSQSMWTCCCGGIPGGSRVLDLGCGTGRPIAGYVLSKGYRLTGVDQAEALLAMAGDMGQYAFVAEKP